MGSMRGPGHESGPLTKRYLLLARRPVAVRGPRPLLAGAGAEVAIVLPPAVVGSSSVAEPLDAFGDTPLPGPLLLSHAVRRRNQRHHGESHTGHDEPRHLLYSVSVSKSGIPRTAPGTLYGSKP
jgi:hypothetical protein